MKIITYILFFFFLIASVVVATDSNRNRPSWYWHEEDLNGDGTIICTMMHFLKFMFFSLFAGVCLTQLYGLLFNIDVFVYE